MLDSAKASTAFEFKRVVGAFACGSSRAGAGQKKSVIGAKIHDTTVIPSSLLDAANHFFDGTRETRRVREKEREGEREVGLYHHVSIPKAC